jgi:hypothetical protein
VIVLSEKDINRDTISQTTDENNLFNLTPEVMQGLCKNNQSLLNEESRGRCLPPKSYIPFEMSDSNVSFKQRNSGAAIKLKSNKSSFQGKVKK